MIDARLPDDDGNIREPKPTDTKYNENTCGFLRESWEEMSEDGRRFFSEQWEKQPLLRRIYYNSKVQRIGIALVLLALFSYSSCLTRCCGDKGRKSSQR